MKRSLPVFILGLTLLGACGLEQPPAKISEELKKLEKPAAEAPAAAPAAEATPAVAAAPADPKLAAGKTVYDASCAGCHESGAMGAPKPGDKAAWAERIPQGLETMVKKSVEGFQGKAGMMPAKGGDASLTDEQVAQAVEFMVESSK